MTPVDHRNSIGRVVGSLSLICLIGLAGCSKMAGAPALDAKMGYQEAANRAASGGGMMGGSGGAPATSSPTAPTENAGPGGPPADGGGKSLQGHASGGAAPGSKAAIAEMATSQPDRYLIKNANLTIEAKDVAKAFARLTGLVQGLKGYISDVNESVDGLGAHQTTLTVRVPYTAFDGSMQQLSDLGKVLDRQIKAEDVTEEFVDTQATVRNLKRTEERLLAHLSRSGKLSDTLLVETELTRVRQEIEQREGRVRFLAHRIAFSTIAITLREEAQAQPLVPAETYSAGKEATGAFRSLVEFGRALLTVLIWTLIWSPVWGVCVYLLWLAIRWDMRRRKRMGLTARVPSHPSGASAFPPPPVYNTPPATPAPPVQG
jgi:hypothetical protein